MIPETQALSSEPNDSPTASFGNSAPLALTPLNREQEQLKLERRPDALALPWSTLFSALFILTLLVTAITLPEYWEHQVRTTHLQLLQQLPGDIMENSDQAVAGSEDGEAITSTTTDSSFYSRQLTSSLENQARVFETFGRLITLILAVVSVLGVFFGFFVRKSIREVEEDMEKKVDRQVEMMDVVQKEFKEDYRRVVDLRKTSDRLVEELETLKNTITARLSDLEASLTVQERARVTGYDANETAARLDEALGEPADE
jgi:uncharacterized membrane-anchored protein YhcB (DUF1043 family)